MGWNCVWLSIIQKSNLFLNSVSFKVPYTGIEGSTVYLTIERLENYECRQKFNISTKDKNNMGLLALYGQN